MYNIKFLVKLNQIWHKHEEMLRKFRHTVMTQLIRIKSSNWLTCNIRKIKEPVTDCNT
jgi:hypothetical protein